MVGGWWLIPSSNVRQTNQRNTAKAVMYEGLMVFLIGCIRAKLDAMHLIKKVGDEMMRGI